MIQQIIAYKNVMAEVAGLIENSPYKKGYIIEKVGIAPPTFYRKLKTNSFTPDELLAIAKLLNPREAILMEMQQSEQEIDEGNYIEQTQLTKQLRKEFV